MSEVKNEERGYRKTRRGYVVSDKMDKTVVVEVEDHVKHALYGKVVRRSSKIKAHDEQNTAGVGDLVLIAETRPLSASKRWRIVEILENNGPSPTSVGEGPLLCLSTVKHCWLWDVIIGESSSYIETVLLQSLVYVVVK